MPPNPRVVFTNEQELVQALQNGDEKAVESLFKSLYQRLCNYANTILNDIDESEEVVQQVFVQLWEKRETMEITTSVQSYLFRAVRNTSFNKIKHAKVRQIYAEEVTAMAQQSEPATVTTFHN